MKLWDFLNSRIGAVLVFLIGFVVVNIIVSHFVFVSRMAWISSSLKDISQKSKDPNNFSIVQNIAEGISGALKKGLGFSSNSDSQENKTVDYLNCKAKVELRDIKLTGSNQKGIEKFLFKIVNHSDQYLSQIKINFSFYDENGDLLDASNKWIAEIKILEPGQEIALSQDRWLNKLKDSEDYEKKSSNIKGVITSFEITKVTGK